MSISPVSGSPAANPYVAAPAAKTPSQTTQAAQPATTPAKTPSQVPVVSSAMEEAVIFSVRRPI